MTPRSESKPILRLLGGADLRGERSASAEAMLAQPKLLATLAYLALEGADGRWQRRDMLVGLLWPELDQAHARAALRKGVHSLRQAFGADAIESRGDEEVRLAEAVLTCDAAEFARALDESRFALAIEWYRGDLLPGFHLPGCVEFERWLDGRRAELRERAGAAAWALASIYERDQSVTLATSWAKRAVRFSWDDERVLRRALLLLNRSGDRAGALWLYDEFARRLKTDFDATPSPETIAVMKQIRSAE
jgi:DNA-binding SARP family transcriptional activator